MPPDLCARARMRGSRNSFGQQDVGSLSVQRLAASALQLFSARTARLGCSGAVMHQRDATNEPLLGEFIAQVRRGCKWGYCALAGIYRYGYFEEAPRCGHCVMLWVSVRRTLDNQCRIHRDTCVMWNVNCGGFFSVLGFLETQRKN